MIDRNDAIGKIERVELREVWERESDLTTWLCDNIDQLGEAIGLALSGAKVEQTTGDFRADIVAQDPRGGLIVVENQLGKSDHDHLGKLLTYFADLKAKAAVWVVADPRPEHVRAVRRLSESMTGPFYLVKVEAITIDKSRPAPLLTSVVRPLVEGVDIDPVTQELGEEAAMRKRFWEGLLARARDRTPAYSSTRPNKSFWLQAPSGLDGVAYTYVLGRDHCEVRVAIQRADPDWNQRVFDDLLADRLEIEKQFGGALDWDRAEDVTCFYIRHRMAVGGYDREKNWPQVQEGMIEAMVRLERALKPHIASPPS